MTAKKPAAHTPAPTQASSASSSKDEGKTRRLDVADFDAEKDSPAAGKNPAELAVEQQWRDVQRLGLHVEHPDSLNTDTPHLKG